LRGYRGRCSAPCWRESLRDALSANATRLYADEPLGLDVNIAGNVYALDSSTIGLCLSLLGWTPFRTTKAAIKQEFLCSTLHLP